MSTDVSLDDPFLPLAFSLFSNPGAYAVLAGAGVSRGAGLPTAWDIVVDLVAQIAGHDGEDSEINSQTAATWYEDKFGHTPTYSTVIERLALTPTERQRLLRKYFEPADDDEGGEVPLGPSVAHRAIARLMQMGVIRVVLTMNFDRLFEQALRELQIEPTTVLTDSDAQGLAPLHTVEHCVIHLHGDYLNASSMRNTNAELSGYGDHMNALLVRVLTDYGMLVAGWSVEHDAALRDAVSAHYSSKFTMGWVAPGPLSGAARALATGKKALVLPTTANDAFGHLADQVESMRERRARHPLSLSVAVNRIKRDLSRQQPAIAAHDMLAAEFTRLRDQPAFHLDRYMDISNYQSLLQQVIEASRIPTGCIAALAYWGDESTHRWWMPELERFARPFAPPSGMNIVLDLPLVAGSIMFYAAGVASVAAQRFDMLVELFNLRGNRTGNATASIKTVLSPSGLAQRPVTAHYEDVAAIVSEALELGVESVDDAIQTFDILRLCAEAMAANNFQTNVDDYDSLNGNYHAVAQLDVDAGAKWQARVDRDAVVDRVAGTCRAHVYGAHVLASERLFFEETRIWGCPLAERLAEDVQRMGDRHPLVRALRVEPEALSLALRGVSVAIGRRGDELQRQTIPVNGPAVFPPELIWLDSEQPPTQY